MLALKMKISHAGIMIKAGLINQISEGVLGLLLQVPELNRLYIWLIQKLAFLWLIYGGQFKSKDSLHLF